MYMFYPVEKYIADFMLLLVQVLVKEIAWEDDLTRGACLCLCLRLGSLYTSFSSSSSSPPLILLDNSHLLILRVDKPSS